MFKFILFAAALVTLHGSNADNVNRFTRQGNFNKYYVYTRENSRQFYELLDTQASIYASPIVLARDTVVIIHGHHASAFNSLNPTVKDALLVANDINIIVVDWSVYASQSYSNAVGAVPSIAMFLATLITNLVGNSRVALNRLHIVGFNLGAHVAGFTGRTLGGGVARITGLDPSKSQWGTNSRRLNASDASYVEVIHTDGNGWQANGLGTAIGHVDFFPNGGGNQPGCFLSNRCSHNRAWELFAASLIHDHLVANRCDTNLQLSMNTCRGYTLKMGNNKYIKLGSGIFRVNTKSTFPY
ncbi:pancreatic lipase-related protein 2-like [Epargyreus clarus]|uniref:pancreatic lipase-related protein 2-like n=1 Tax=Epargyreus clarus TaxID=520877 RepID=UPI003C2F88F6